MPFTPDTASLAGKQSKRGAGIKALKMAQMFRDLVEENFDQLKEDYLTVKPETRLNFTAKMAPYLMNRLIAIDSHITLEGMSSEEVNDVFEMVLGEANYQIPAAG